MTLESVLTQSPTPSTVPAGTKIAADALTSGEIVQYVKLISGINGDETPVQAGANGLYVDVRSSAPVAISGTPNVAVPAGVAVTNFPATQPISGSITITGTPSVSVSNWPATQPVSAAALPLPSGAATAAKQPAITLAGTSSNDVLTIQGVSTGVPLPVASHPVTQGSPPWAVTQSGVWNVGLTGTVDTELPAPVALGDGVANPTPPTVGAAGLGFNGTTWDRVRVSPVGTTIAAGQPGVLGVQGVTGGIAVATAASLAAAQVAIPLWGHGVNGVAAPTSSTEQGGQVGPSTNVDNAALGAGVLTPLLADPVGKQVVLPYCTPATMVSGATAAMTATTSTLVLAAAPSGHRNYITQITVTNSHATVGTDILIQDGATTIYVIPAAAVYGGATISFPVPLRQSTSATAINAQNVVTGASTRVSISGYVGR